MGMLIDGAWHAEVDRYMVNGAFKREASSLPRRTPSELAEALQNDARIVFIGSQSCPWSHRAALVRAIKGLSNIPVAIAGGPRTQGYALPGEACFAPMSHVHELYTSTDPHYTGRATVPVLWNTEDRCIVSNDSASIARAFDKLGQGWRLAPEIQAAELDALNSRVYSGLSNAVYRAGFAASQLAYDAAVDAVFDSLSWLEARLTRSRCLFGTQITEADLFLFATLVRFDAVYAPLFRCTRRRLIEHPALWAYSRDLYSWPGIAQTFDAEANLVGYFRNDTDNNPHGIVPDAPEIDWSEPHGRQGLGALTVWLDGALVPFCDMSETDGV